MEDSKLITLREISEQLGVNYRTIIDYKNHFRKFVKLRYDGQYMKYPEVYVDFFRMIIALKEEGYSTSVIKMALNGDIGLPGQEHIKDWLLEWKDGCTHPSSDGGVHSQMDGCIHPSQDGGNHPQMDGGAHPSGDGGIHPQMEEYIQSGLAQIKQEIYTQVPELIQDNLSELIAQLNSSITKFYKTVTELQEKVLDLDHRLRHLERELSGEPNSEIKQKGTDT